MLHCQTQRCCAMKLTSPNQSLCVSECPFSLQPRTYQSGHQTSYILGWPKMKIIVKNKTLRRGSEYFPCINQWFKALLDCKVSKMDLPVLLKVTFVRAAVREGVRSRAVVHVVFEFSFVKSPRGMLQGPSAMHL